MTRIETLRVITATLSHIDYSPIRKSDETDEQYANSCIHAAHKVMCSNKFATKLGELMVFGPSDSDIITL